MVDQAQDSTSDQPQHRREYETGQMAVMEWTANAFLWVAGATMSISPELAGRSWLLFAGLFVGQVLWGFAAYSMRKWSLFATSVFFGLLNIYGVIVRF